MGDIDKIVLFIFINQCNGMKTQNLKHTFNVVSLQQ